jgi:hypothetical protein
MTGVTTRQLHTHSFEKGKTMKSFTIPVIAAGAMAAAALGFAGTANAAPSGPSTADETVRQLKADGLTVILNKFGTAPLDQCTVDAVRPGQTFARMDSGAPGAMDDIVTTVTSSTVYVDVSC